MKKLAFATLATAILSGCAATAPLKEIAPGHVAVVAAQYPPQADFNAYAHGRGVNAVAKGGRGALTGGAIGATPLLVLGRLGHIGMVAGAVIAAPLMAVGTVVGGAAGIVHGAATGMSSEQVSAIHDPIKRTRTDAALQGAIAERVVELSATRRRNLVTYLPAAGPAKADLQPLYEELKPQGFDAVLELAVTSVGFEARSEESDTPSARLAMALRARVVPLADGASPWTREWRHSGAWRNVTAWQADDGTLLRQELDDALRDLAANVQQIL